MQTQLKLFVSQTIAQHSPSSTSFSEEKEAKRLFLIWAAGVQNSRLQINKSFLRRFFFKKAAAFFRLTYLTDP